MLILFLVTALALAGGEYRFEASVDAMGSTFTVVAYSENRQALQPAVEAALEEARRLDNLLSNYKPSSEWSRVNQFAAERPVTVSPELFRLLAACVEYSRASEGAFDITVGPLMKLWGFYKGSGRLPHRAEVRGVLGRIGHTNLVLDHEKRTVRFARPGVEIDSGGIGKGYAVDMMVQILKDGGLRSALITGGGSSIYGLGTPPGEPGWPVEIRHPKTPGKTEAKLVLKNESMSTSGSYEKFFRAEGRVWSHIMDPRTGFPAQGALSVSVIAPRAIDSEAWTKPYFINGREWAAAHKPRDFRVFFCEDAWEASCAWLQ